MSQLVGWDYVPIGDLCSLNNGRAFKPAEWSNKGLPIVRIQNLNDLDAKFNHYSGEFGDRYHLKGGELLFAWSGTPGTSFGAHVWRGGEALLNQHIFRVDFDEKAIERRFFRYAINQKLDELIGKAHGGVGLRHVTKGKFEQTEIALPPRNEQTRIADKIDLLLTTVNGCRERLDRMPQILKKFREAVLEAAVSGRLTEEWRASNEDHVPWVDGTFGSTGHVSGGLTKNATRAAFAFRRPYLRVANVYTNRLELDDVTEIGMTLAEWDKTRLQPGDLLIVEGNGSIDHIGRAARWGGELPECSHQNHLIRWRTHGKVDSRFALLWLMSPVGRSALMDLASTSAGLYTLSISKISKVPMRVPSAQEQAEIIRRSDDLLAHADALVRQYDNCMVKLKKLTPSILAKAFRGELVPQDPNDEPAGQMLERMRASGSTDQISTPKLRAAAGRRT